VSPFTILVEFMVAPEDMAAFLPLMLTNAQTSLKEEEGCERFDVLRAEGEEDRILLYEIYRDRAAFDAHATSAHFKAFDEATRSMVRRKSVTVLNRCAPVIPDVP
jgi:autoinducer 2-degrading protein